MLQASLCSPTIAVSVYRKVLDSTIRVIFSEDYQA